jgi:hypothetical protein
MNPRRAEVSVYLADENALNELALSLLESVIILYWYDGNPAAFGLVYLMGRSCKDEKTV